MLLFNYIISLFLLIGCGTQNVSVEKKVDSLKFSNRDILYTAPYKGSIEDEYVEGGLYGYNIINNYSYLIKKDILVDYTRAWITKGDECVIFSINQINEYDKYGKHIEEFSFNENQIVLGATYHKLRNKFYFLLREENITSLCEYSPESKELKKRVDNVELDYSTVETPFIEIGIEYDKYLVLEVACYNFISIDLDSYSVSNIELAKNKFCEGKYFGFSKDKIIYMVYTNIEKTKYELREYDLLLKKENILIEGENKKGKKVEVDLLCSLESEKFLVVIDEVLYSYDYKDFNKMEIPTDNIIQFEREKLLHFNNFKKVSIVSL